MKNLNLLFLLLICLGFQSCKKDQAQENVEAKKMTEKPIRTECFKAIYEKDTLDLKINTLQNNKVSGDLQMRIFNMPIKKGEIAGEIHGDTLFVSYSFHEGDNEKTGFKNPMALLKRENELILGNGKMETTMGATYFTKGSPIDFDRVKYKFKPIDCADVQ